MFMGYNLMPDHHGSSALGTKLSAPADLAQITKGRSGVPVDINAGAQAPPVYPPKVDAGPKALWAMGPGDLHANEL